MQLLYTLTAFVQREIRWAVILRYTKRFAIYLFSSEQVLDCMRNGQDVLLRLDVQGAATVHKLLSQDAVFIFMVAESEMALVKWLVERKTESFDELLIRIATARKEVELMSEFDYVVVNADGRLEQTVSKICSIIDTEKAQVHQHCAQL